MRVWWGIIAATSGLWGAAGVALAAAAAHLGAGEPGLASTAASFLMVHAAALVGFCALAAATELPVTLAIAASLLASGTLLFSGHLALHALTGLVPVAFAAPLGGSLLILGWLVAAAAVPMALRKRPVRAKSLRA